MPLVYNGQNIPQVFGNIVFQGINITEVVINQGGVSTTVWKISLGGKKKYMVICNGNTAWFMDAGAVQPVTDSGIYGIVTLALKSSYIYVSINGGTEGIGKYAMGTIYAGTMTTAKFQEHMKELATTGFTLIP